MRRKKLPKLTQSESFRSESTKRRVIMFLNYHGLESVSQFILKTKSQDEGSSPMLRIGAFN